MSTTRRILRAIERDRLDEAENFTFTLAGQLNALRLKARRGTGSDSVLELRRTIAEIEVALSELTGARWIDYDAYESEEELVEAIFEDPDKFIIEQMVRNETDNGFDAEIFDMACRLTLVKALVAQGLDSDVAVDTIDRMGDISWDVAYDGDTGKLSVHGDAECADTREAK